MPARGECINHAHYSLLVGFSEGISLVRRTGGADFVVDLYFSNLLSPLMRQESQQKIKL